MTDFKKLFQTKQQYDTPITQMERDAAMLLKEIKRGQLPLLAVLAESSTSSSVIADGYAMYMPDSYEVQDILEVLGTLEIG